MIHTNTSKPFLGFPLSTKYTERERRTFADMNIGYQASFLNKTVGYDTL